MQSITVGCNEISVSSVGILLKNKDTKRFIARLAITQILLDNSDSSLKTITAIVDKKEQVPLAVFYSSTQGDINTIYNFIIENLYV